jgi:Icc-related predicted phosphoesterase
MNLVMFSDSHGACPTIPEGDVLCVAGDVFCGDDLQSLKSDLRWLASLPHQRKLFVQGNHDLILKMQSNAEELLAEEGITLLNNNSIAVDGVRFYGVPYGGSDIQPCDVLVSHVPPAGVLDKGLYGKAIGCPRLLTAVRMLKPRVHIFGHAHESAGHTKIDETDFYNCAEKPTSVHISS